MKIQYLVTAAAAVAMTAGLGALAQATSQGAGPAIVPVERIYVQPANPPFGPYHGGYTTEGDARLLSDAVGALSVERGMNGVVVTMVANHGELVVNGTATVSQGARIDSMLKRLAGVTRVTSWFSTSGA